MSSAQPGATPRSWQEILLNRRMLICLFQGFASGMPLYVLIQLVPGWLRTHGVDLATIGLFSIVQIPYTWKFLWSPLLDRYRLPFLGRRRGWMLVSQCLLLLSIGALGTTNPAFGLRAVVALVFVTAFFSATQDIVLDAYRRELLSEAEFGTGNSVFINAYRLSSLVPASLAFVLADSLPWAAVYWIVAAFMVVGIVTTLVVAEVVDERVAPTTLYAAVVEPFLEFFSRGNLASTVAVLAFVVLYKLGDNMATALQTPFFIDLGFSLTQIGTIAKYSALWGSVTGAALGGLAMTKISINRALWLFGALQVVSILGFAALARLGANPFALFAAVSFEYLGVGMGAVALWAFMARETSIRFTATQLALMTALAAMPRVFANATTGFIVEAIGYFNFFLVCTVVALPGMLLLLRVAPWSGLGARDQASGS
jgi:MFS transporter, PAT family, beta-lactamase induction signal transducer AmpG